MPAGKYLVYEHFTRACRILDRDQAWTLSLGPGRQALFTICPIKQGFAYAGLVDKYISAKAVEKCRRGNKRVQLTLREAGEFGFYSNRRPKHTEMNGIEVAVRRAAQGMYFVKPKEKPRPGRKAVVTIDF
jgi:hypothetical protein